MTQPPGDPKPSVTSQPGSTNRHFEGIGGIEGARRLAERFYYYMDVLEEAATVRALHPPDLTRPREVLTRYLTEWTGGPPVYSAERGHPRLRRRHRPFPIGPSERDGWMLCMRRALSEVVQDENLRVQLEQAFWKVADFLRNDTPHTHHVAGAASEKVEP
jgi:hemoglobin